MVINKYASIRKYFANIPRRFLGHGMHNRSVKRFFFGPIIEKDQTAIKSLLERERERDDQFNIPIFQPINQTTNNITTAQ